MLLLLVKAKSRLSGFKSKKKEGEARKRFCFAFAFTKAKSKGKKQKSERGAIKSKRVSGGLSDEDNNTGKRFNTIFETNYEQRDLNS